MSLGFNCKGREEHGNIDYCNPTVSKCPSSLASGRWQVGTDFRGTVIRTSKVFNHVSWEQFDSCWQQLAFSLQATLSVPWGQGRGAGNQWGGCVEFLSLGHGMLLLVLPVTYLLNAVISLEKVMPPPGWTGEVRCVELCVPSLGLAPPASRGVKAEY